MGTDVFTIFSKEGNKAAEKVAALAIKQKSILNQVLEGAVSKSKKVKNASAKCLREISRTTPQKLYPHFKFFDKLIDDSDTILKWNAIEVLCNLTEVDNTSKFNNRVLNKYFTLLSDESMVTAANTITALGKVAQHKPRLRNKITKELVRVDKLPHSSECRNIFVGKALEAFENYVEKVKNKKVIVDFAQKHLNNKRNATRKKAWKLVQQKI